jgi:hypothetical protein
VKRILLALADYDLAATVHDELLNVLADEVLVHSVGDEKSAIEYLQGQRESPYSLVAVHLGLPEDRKSPRNDKDQRGLALVESLRRIDPSVNIILVSPIEDASVYTRLTQLGPPPPHFVLDGKLDTITTLVSVARDLLTGVHNRARTRVRVVINLAQDSRNSSYTLEVGGLRWDSGQLNINDEELLDIVEESRENPEILAYPRWEMAMRRIGGRLSRAIFQNNWKFNQQFSYLLGQHGNAEVCFDVPRDYYPALWEALTDPTAPTDKLWNQGKRPEREFWMFRDPIYRRLFSGNGGRRFPLFQGVQGVPNCLIIESDVNGVVGDLNDESGSRLTLRSLKNVPLEAEWLRTQLPLLSPPNSLGQIKVLNGSEARKTGVSLKELVKKTLEGGTEWDLVHYAGHCHYDAAQQKGFLFFPGERLIEALDIREFGTWLRHARFVYLSGCDSSGDDFVFELASNSVPAALGFRWKIEDQLAQEFTKSFYTSLFAKTRSLEYAFFEARKESRKQFKDKRIWAAPILVMQSSGELSAISAESGAMQMTSVGQTLRHTA